MENLSETMREVFSQALEKTDPKERSEFLDNACGENHDLRKKLDDLIALHSQLGDFLESPPFIDEPAVDNIPTESVGTVIGHYKLLENIGEGGMAVVYMAEQQEPIRRKVALKIIKLGMDTRQVIARFEAERQALAMMDHPNIAKVLDAGATDTGRPYFVMELVTGGPITEYCDANNLSTKERLTLFIPVCQAVQHAHQKGIIHRDIKPSNVMVTQRDGVPVPKVIDFGIAKATNQKLTEKTLFTRYARIVGTPAYMSPEQAEMSGLDVDTRTDIYSLGVLLYELLTGATPFDADELREAGYSKMQRIICEEDPVKPSTKVSTLGGTQAKTVEHRQTNPESLSKLIRGDLDWIVMKSLEKDRTRRYETAAALAMDVRRHLNHEPVLAGSPGVVYRLKKLARKHRAPLIAAAGIFTAALVALVFAAMYIRAEVQRRRAEVEIAAREVQTRLSRAQTLHAEGRYRDALRQVKPILESETVGPEAHLLHARLLFEVGQPDNAADELQQLVTNQPERTAGAAHYLLALVYSGTDPAKALEHRRRAESLPPQTADAYYFRAMASSNSDSTIQLLSEAIDLDPGHHLSHKALSLAHYTCKDYRRMEQEAYATIMLRQYDWQGYALRAIARRELGRFDDAIKDHDRAIRICDVEPTLYDQRRETFFRMGKYQAALLDARRCVDLEPAQFFYRFRLFTALASAGDYEAARQEYEQIIDTGLAHEKQFEEWAKRHVFDVLGAGQSFELPGDILRERPLSVMQEAADYYDTLKAQATRLARGVYGQSSWSPDGTQLAYGRSDWYVWPPEALSDSVPAISEPSGIEIMNVESMTTHLLVDFGSDPAWSPDGEHIAFVSVPRQLLPSEEEIWIIPAAGGEPRCLVSGASPVWSDDSKRLFFTSRIRKTVCSIAVDDALARPQSVLPCPVWHPRVSPDGQHVAYAVGNELRIVELLSGLVKTSWVIPGPQTDKSMLVNWSPDGKELSIGAWSDLGLWVFNVEDQEGRQIFGPPARSCIWSPDKSRIVVKIENPFEENWLVTLDSNIPTYKAISSALIPKDFLLHKREQYVRAAQTDPENADGYLRKLAWLGMNYYRSGSYEEALTTLIRVDELRRTVSDHKSHLEDIALIVMTLRALGREAEAQSALVRLQRLWEQRKHTYLEFTFGTPIPVPNVSSEYDECAPHISSDGLSLYFCGWRNNRPGGCGKADIWVSKRTTTGHKWGLPENLGLPVNSPSMDCSPCISSNGRELFFVSRRAGGLGDADIYVTRRESPKAPWGEPENLGPALNGPAWDGAPNLSSDSLTLYFHSWRGWTCPGGDIFVTTRASLSEPWSEPASLGEPVNTDICGEWDCSISQDGLVLFFCDGMMFRPEGYGGGDLWVATRPMISSPWSKPVNLGQPINSSARDACMSVSADCSTIYFHSDRPGGPGAWNIWEAPILDWAVEMEIDGDEDLAEKLVERYYGKGVISGEN